MKANPDKLRFIILGSTDSLTLQINDITINLICNFTWYNYSFKTEV